MSVTETAEPALDPSVLPAAEVVRILDTDLDQGLTSEEAARRLAATGPNALASAPPVPTWRKLLAQLQDPLVYLLLAAVAISVVAWLVEGAEGWPVDGVVIAAIVVLNAILGYVQEARAEQAVAALKRLSAATASVVRDGEPTRIPTSEVVPGDLVVLAEGDTVAADARLTTAADLQLAEASLTGESQPVGKDAAVLPAPTAVADRSNMIFNGTSVTRGTGRAVVTATGMATELGKVADLLEQTVEEPTPLQREISRVGRLLGIAVVAIAIVVMGTIALTTTVNSSEDVVGILLLGVSLAVAAVPEGLPAILSVVLAIGVQRMAADKAIVKKLSSVETLGSASVICSDKTGTLTRSEMTVQRVSTASGEVTVTGVGYAPDGALERDGEALTDGPVRDEVARVLAGGALASDARLHQSDGEWQVHGDPTEAALLVAERKLGPVAEREARFRRVGVVPFSSARKLMTSLEADAERDGRITVVTKGAPDVLLGRCTHRQVGDALEPLTEDQRAAVLAEVERLSGDAYRTLAVAYRELDATEPPTADESVERDLVYAGTVGIIDPPRDEVAVAVADARRAGIRVVMITGDHPSTAARIATDLGIVEPGATALTGVELDELAEAELRAVVADTSVYARVAPVHKLRIVDALQANGAVVAMTGDGVNDAPALKSADIGIAMGITGTEVTKEAAKMILADDNFATIVVAVRRGREIFDNIRKFLRYLLSSNMGEVLTVFGGVVLAGVIGLTTDSGAVALPLLATQILWINLLTDTGPALAMGVEPDTDDVMNRPPRSLSDRVIDARMWGGVLLVGLVMAVTALFALDLYLPGGLVEGSGTLDEARTVAFTVLVFAQLYNCLNARSELTSAFHRLFANRWLWAAIALAIVLQLGVVNLPFLNEAFGTVPLTVEQWLVSAALASAVLWVAEIRKLVWRLVLARRTADSAPAAGRSVVG